MSPTLYHSPLSSPSRAALLAVKALGIDIDVTIVDIRSKKQLNPDFIKLNPQHTVPTLVDGDFVLWDSHAIGPYLVRTYGKDDTLYPTDPKKKAIVDQRLYFDCGTLERLIRKFCFPKWAIKKGEFEDVEVEMEIVEECKTWIDEALGMVDVFLEGSNFAAGDNLTLADCSLVASVSTIAAVGWDLSPYANVSAWVARCALSIPNYDETNQAGAEKFGKEIRATLPPGCIN